MTADGPIVLDSLAALAKYDHGVLAHCDACGHETLLDLPAVVERHGDRPIPGVRVRCSACGEPGRIQVRPPMPTFTGYPKFGERA